MVAVDRTGGRDEPSAVWQNRSMAEIGAVDGAGPLGALRLLFWLRVVAGAARSAGARGVALQAFIQEVLEQWSSAHPEIEFATDLEIDEPRASSARGQVQIGVRGSRETAPLAP
jgi:hypothetical protein